MSEIGNGNAKGNGHSNIRRKATDAEKQRRIEEAAALIARGWSNWEIRRALMHKYSITITTAGKYLGLGHRVLAEEVNVERHQLVAASYAFYQSIKRDQNVELGLRLAAQARIDKLMGLETAAKLEVTGPNGGPLQVLTMSAREAIEEMQRRGLWGSLDDLTRQNLLEAADGKVIDVQPESEDVEFDDGEEGGENGDGGGVANN